MSGQSITLSLPSHLYEIARQRAHARRHTIEAELTEVIEVALETDEWQGIEPDIAEAVRQLEFLDDDHLWRAARTTVPEETTDRMQYLAERRRSTGLSAAEEREAVRYGHLAQRVMLVRAEAAALLRERGYDVSVLLHAPSAE